MKCPASVQWLAVRDRAGKGLLRCGKAVFSRVTLAVVVFPMSFKRLWMVPSLCLLLGGMAYAGGEYVGERNSFNRFHGSGVYTYTNGSVYDGQWVDGRKQGQGKQTQPDGSLYAGEWRDNQQHGKGRMRWANGDTYEGGWSDGRMHGKGVFSSASGDRYQGGFIANKREGTGVLTRRNGERFEGLWKDGLREGLGVLNKPGVGVISGRWSNDKLNGDATVTFTSGDRYFGALQNDVPNGKGTCKSKTASAPCEYKDGKLLVAEAKPVVKPVNKPAVNPADLQASRSEIAPVAPTSGRPSSTADIIRRTAAIEAVNRSPVTAAGIPVPSLALKTDAPQFSFQHDWSGVPTKNNSLPVVFAEKDIINFGDVKIRAEGGDVAVTLVVDEYSGPGVYPLKYFKASIAKDGVASYQTAAAEPGEIQITYDDGKTLKGTFRFVAYRNGNPATQEKRSVSQGLFVVPLRAGGNAAQ